MATYDKAAVAALQEKFRKGEVSKKAFLEGALQAGVTIQTAYTILDQMLASPDRTAALPEDEADRIKEDIEQNFEWKVVGLASESAGPKEAAPGAAGASDVKSRIVLLREKVRRAAAAAKPPDTQKAPLDWVAWDNDWPKWANFENWHNWNNIWGNFNNWDNIWHNQ